jgi:DNA ligase (NAD+)
VSLHYDASGRLLCAVTRGDGKKGDDVTGVVRSIQSVPQQLSELPGAPLVVRGEVYMPRVEFDRLNHERTEVNMCMCLQSDVSLLTSECAIPNSL